MIGIYKDSFKTFLEQNVAPVKQTSKNFIARCPFCEMNQNKKHYHLHIALNAPIWHCFHCENGGLLHKLLQKLAGVDVSEKYVDQDVLKEVSKRQPEEEKKLEKEIIIPEIDEKEFHLKSLFMKQRLGYVDISLSSVKGLIFDVNKFLELNSIPINPDLFRMKDFLQTNFVGVLTEHQSKVIFRNIDPESDFRYYKLQLQNLDFLDYYKLLGGSYFSNQVVLAEGIFDILSESLFDNLNLKQSTKLYAAGLSKSYESLIKSLVFHENIFRMQVVILSDKDVELNKYKSLKKYNEHIIEKITVFYNKQGKDFGEFPIIPEKFVI